MQRPALDAHGHIEIHGGAAASRQQALQQRQQYGISGVHILQQQTRRKARGVAGAWQGVKVSVWGRGAKRDGSNRCCVHSRRSIQHDSAEW